MLFVFRGTRNLQVVVAILAMCFALACVLLLKRYADGGSPLLMVPAILLGLAFLWSFAATLRLPTSFVAIADERTRIRFAGLVDTVLDNREILDARLVSQPFWSGLGVRTNFRGRLSLASASGASCELTLARPVRIWLIPRVLPVSGRALRLSVRNPELMVERLGKSAGRAGSEPVRSNRGKRRQ